MLRPWLNLANVKPAQSVGWRRPSGCQKQANKLKHSSKTERGDLKTRTPAHFFLKKLRNSLFFNDFPWARRRALATIFYQPLKPPQPLSASTVWGIRCIAHWHQSEVKPDRSRTAVDCKRFSKPHDTSSKPHQPSGRQVV